MNSSLASLVTSIESTPSSIPSLPLESADPVPAHHANPVVAFIIGLAIVTLASILNAAGLNLTKLDHVRTSAKPKASRKKDWLRPLWLLGMMLYILSQLLGSTLALEYLRAEYVAPLGSTSLIFNFLFAKFLVDSPVTQYDIWGTIIVIIGVIGIVAFGSINSGIESGTSAKILTSLWTRGNWLAYFFFMSFTLIGLYIFISQLDAVLAARSDLSAAPFGSSGPSRNELPRASFVGRVKAYWDDAMDRIKAYLEIWTGPHEDKRIAWTLGIGWACCGGGLAGGTLVFAKAAVQLISGSLSHENTGNQFGHASTIFTFVLLAVTAVMQIICLNRGLRVYDSTLVVPVFYGVYTAMGFLDSLIFNNEVDAYESWTLFLIFVSIIILVSGVVLLTHKKPDKHASTENATALATISPTKHRRKRGEQDTLDVDAEAGFRDDADDGVPWQVGEASDDEGEPSEPSFVPRGTGLSAVDGTGERQRMIHEADEEDEHHRGSTSSDATLARPDGEVQDEFRDWETGKILK